MKENKRRRRRRRRRSTTKTTTRFPVRTCCTWECQASKCPLTEVEYFVLHQTHSHPTTTYNLSIPGTQRPLSGIGIDFFLWGRAQTDVTAALIQAQGLLSPKYRVEIGLKSHPTRSSSPSPSLSLPPARGLRPLIQGTWNWESAVSSAPAGPSGALPPHGLWCMLS